MAIVIGGGGNPYDGTEGASGASMTSAGATSGSVSGVAGSGGPGGPATGATGDGGLGGYGGSETLNYTPTGDDVSVTATGGAGGQGGGGGGYSPTLGGDGGAGGAATAELSNGSLDAGAAPVSFTADATGGAAGAGGQATYNGSSGEGGDATAEIISNSVTNADGVTFIAEAQAGSGAGSPTVAFDVNSNTVESTAAIVIAVGPGGSGASPTSAGDPIDIENNTFTDSGSHQTDVLNLEFGGTSTPLETTVTGNHFNATGSHDVLDIITTAPVLFSDNGTQFTINGGAANYDSGYSEIEVNGVPQVLCYTPDVLILTDRGEVRAGDLALGDRVVTLSGELKPIRWIGRRSYAGRFVAGNRRIFPICIKAGALGDRVPKRDLWVSPLHALYLEDVLVAARDLVNGVSVVQAEEMDEVHYLHLELDEHDVIFAEGAAAETFRDAGCRGMFQNAAEFERLYPGKPLMAPFAPLIDGGDTLHAIRRRIDARAGLELDAGPLEGWIGRIEHRRVSGWAMNPVDPRLPVRLDVLVDGQVVAQTLANRYRGDLETAGIGTARHGFEVALDQPLVDGPLRVEVRRSADARPLPLAHPLKAEKCRLEKAITAHAA